MSVDTICITLKFITPCVAKGRIKNGVHSFIKDNVGNVVFKQAWWDKLLKAAAENCDIDSNYFRRVLFKRTITLDKPLQVQSRSVFDLNVSPRYSTNQHEVIDAGTTAELEALLPKGVILSKFRDAFDVMGVFSGISPFSWKNTVYGRFVVEGMNGKAS